MVAPTVSEETGFDPEKFPLDLEVCLCLHHF